MSEPTILNMTRPNLHEIIGRKEEQIQALGQELRKALETIAQLKAQLALRESERPIGEAG